MYSNSRWFIPFAILAVLLLAACADDKKPTIEPDDSQSLSSLPSSDPVQPATAKYPGLTDYDVIVALFNEGLTTETGGNRDLIRDKSLQLFFMGSAKPENEIGDEFFAYAALENHSNVYSPESPYDIEVEIEIHISGPLEMVPFKRVVDPNETRETFIWLVTDGRIRTEQLPQEGSIHGSTNMKCKEKGTGSYSITARATSPQGEAMSVTLDQVVKCVDKPTLTPQPLVGRTAEVQTLVFDGLHYPLAEFQYVGVGGDPTCTEPSVSHVWLGYIQADGTRVTVNPLILSFEDPTGPPLVANATCGFGLASEVFHEVLFEVDLAVYEAFCDQYVDRVFTRGHDTLQVEGSMIKTCESTLAYLRR